MLIKTISYLLTFVGSVAALMILPGSIELLLLTIAGIFPARKIKGQNESDKKMRLAVVIPAHNEENGVTESIKSVFSCSAREAEFDVVVIADNCSDATAERAASAGARVLTRRNEELRGKGYTLDFAFNSLLPEGYDGFLVIDADTVVQANLIDEVARLFKNGAEAVQCRYGVKNADSSVRTRLMNVALMAINHLRPRGRENLCLSVGIFGNGFGLKAETLRVVGYNTITIDEDLEYHLLLVRAGVRVRFTDRTAVFGEMPSQGKGVTTQRARWEGGRFRLIKIFAPRLLRDVFQGKLWLIEPLLELLLLPLAFHVVLLLLVLVQPIFWLRVFGLVCLSLVVIHLIAALWVGKARLKDVLALFFVPFYVVWKLALLGKIFQSTKQEAEWVRTQRE
jgi:cellulose synthase/poly-beta-1,6-N-acetylglucosamine synthase-like glycosyltransferase